MAFHFFSFPSCLRLGIQAHGDSDAEDNKQLLTMYLASSLRNLADLAVAQPLSSKRCCSESDAAEMPELVRREAAGRLAKVRRSLNRTPGLAVGVGAGVAVGIVGAATIAAVGSDDNDSNDEDDGECGKHRPAVGLTALSGTWLFWIASATMASN